MGTHSRKKIKKKGKQGRTTAPPIRVSAKGLYQRSFRWFEESESRYKQKNSSVVDCVESHFVEIFDSEDSVPSKVVFKRYQDFCSDKGIKRAFSKKDFRLAFVSEGYRIENSTKHANQLRIIVY